MDSKDFYGILELPKNSNINDIKKNINNWH